MLSLQGGEGIVTPNGNGQGRFPRLGDRENKDRVSQSSTTSPGNKSFGEKAVGS